MDIPMQNEQDKVKPSFELSGDNHPMVEGMHPGKTYHMKVKTKMIGKEVRKGEKGEEKTHGRFEIHHAEDQTKDQSIGQIMRDGAEEESSKHESKESKKHEKQEEGE